MQVSIFNDVIGPVMRGSSSSHCAAALRIGRLARDLMGADITRVLVEFDAQGSLPTTHDSQGSDMGLCGGLLGWDAADSRLPDSVATLRDSGIRFDVAVVDTRDPHPNTYRLTLANARERHTLIAISTGGGMMEVLEIDGFPVSIGGDYSETLVFLPDPSQTSSAVACLRAGMQADDIAVSRVESGTLVRVRAQGFAGDALEAQLRGMVPGMDVRRLGPVLPVRSRAGLLVPFSTAAELVSHDAGRNRPLWEWAVEYEMARGGLTHDEVVSKMVDIVRLLRTSIGEGIAGTTYEDRMLGHQSGEFKRHLEADRLLDTGALARTVLYVTALMEVKSSMGVIVAAPTAGACAALPGSCIAFAEEMGKSEEDMARAMLAAGAIGLFIASQWTFAAEVGGCQAEGGSAAAMAAAALVTLAGGTLPQALAAASMALQSMLGLICDPVAGRVEVPCLGKNVLAASHAASCANMALAGFDQIIPFDEVVDAARRVAGRMPREHRCTALGGLADTPTARALEAGLAARKGCVTTCGL
ncbi:MAG: L-serine ammonia-lyase, iron-sulfur-dependent, subunit alpha [Acidobacteria bacterium]|nr:L-serine ammonia-lyase, iron-sulfur-dependent, subunit alpha [Acidobacteriota bacterium]